MLSTESRSLLKITVQGCSTLDLEDIINGPGSLSDDLRALVTEELATRERVDVTTLGVPA